MRFNSTKKAAVDRNLLSGSPGPQCGGLGHLPTGGFFAAVSIKLNHSAEQIALESRARPQSFGSRVRFRLAIELTVD